MLRISKLADYATLIMSALAKEADKLTSASVLARQLGLSLPVVSKILKMLGQAELLTSTRGVEGGYRLARPAAEISVAEIVSAIEGKFSVTECCRESSGCAITETCTTKSNWQSINQVIYSTLAKLTLKDMMGNFVNHG